MKGYVCDRCSATMIRHDGILYRTCDCRKSGYTRTDDGEVENLILSPFKAGPGFTDKADVVEGGSAYRAEVVKDTNPKDAVAAAQGRVPIGLFPDTAIIFGAMAMHEGACKYGRYNYRITGVSASVYHDALERHLKAWWNGQDVDPDSGLLHLAKMLACNAILLDALTCGKLKDDRPPTAPVADLLAQLKTTVKEIEDRLKDHHPKQYTLADSVKDPCQKPTA